MKITKKTINQLKEEYGKKIVIYSLITFLVITILSRSLFGCMGDTWLHIGFPFRYYSHSIIEGNSSTRWYIINILLDYLFAGLLGIAFLWLKIKYKNRVKKKSPKSILSTLIKNRRHLLKMPPMMLLWWFSFVLLIALGVYLNAN